ncbi:ATPase [Pacificimonas flava]|uniref:ATPase n=2 Tax=Pacificimonas TaxID=1960290 RepID=A0A219B7B9_9SPHN|nr:MULTISPECIES: DUF815 domain-containing protein [Pacificimonas]MBZ6378655.1 DUF815 domain-containing protein [Pacificimonas aurantium]OWV34074.1 ATPase [Pacificimonas flava]
MSQQLESQIARIADALERRFPPELQADLYGFPAYRWSLRGLEAVERLRALPMSAFAAMDRQKELLHGNSQRFAEGRPAHDALLWGARGMGKSALCRSAAAEAGLAVVQVEPERIGDLEVLLSQLAKAGDRRFIVLIDDFGVDATVSVHRLRSLLDGSIEARAANALIYVTSNRRHLVPRAAGSGAADVHERDAQHDELALAERFGLSIGFHEASEADYLAICHSLAAARGVGPVEKADALAFAHMRGARSGRIAAHYVTDLAGRD